MNSEPEELPTPRTDSDTEAGEPESKSQRKRNAHQITELASRLVQMKPKVLAALSLEPGIREAIKHCAEIKSHGARKRQLHFVSKLLRDTENIQDLQERVLYPDLTKKRQAQKQQDTANPHMAIRDRLIEDFAGTAEELRENYPDVELQKVRQLVRNTHAELKKAQAAKEKTEEDESAPVNANSTKAAKSLLKLLATGS